MGLKGGRYTFKAYGDPDKLIHGEVIIEGGVMRDFKAYNNTLAIHQYATCFGNTAVNQGFRKKVLP